MEGRVILFGRERKCVALADAAEESIGDRDIERQARRHLHQQAAELAASVNRLEDARVQLNDRIRQKVTELNRYRP